MKGANFLWPLTALTLTTIIFWCAVVINVHAAVPAMYTNENFFTSTHDRPVSFTQDSAGNFFGTTQTGKRFEQRVITNALNIRLQRFMIDEAFFYISDKGIITAPSDTVALSIYLTRTG